MTSKVIDGRQPIAVKSRYASIREYRGRGSGFLRHQPWQTRHRKLGADGVTIRAGLVEQKSQKEPQMSRFEGKRILITGATSGIGRAGALRIASEGGEVIATGRDETALGQLQQELPSSATVLQNDVSIESDIRKLAALVANKGGIDGLWLNAGFARVAALTEITAQDFDLVFGANLKGPVLQMAALAEYLHEGSAVVLTSSTAAYEGAPAASLYAAAKGAQIAVARCWADALGPRNIRVNTLVPGPIDTNFREFMDARFREDFESDVTSRLALTRMGTAAEAAAVGLFLLSDEASFVTGSQYFVDGGLVMQ
jgi:NAD(P)-dependent dehydrogenase (short-subunit alcohol dehydrogenase family)